jgi:hypothetical protein
LELNCWRKVCAIPQSAASRGNDCTADVPHRSTPTF